ncbi:MAG: hypothetical protein NTW49_03010 [Bacteroidia bacterium]|nr:hypothetical protein [Bacteroidia bacterium]
MFIIFICWSVSKMNAQIVYTDIDPDTTITAPVGSWGTFDIDIDNDGTNDFLLNHDNSTMVSDYRIIEMTSDHTGAEVLCDTFSIYSPLALNYLDTINSGQFCWYFPDGWMIPLNDNGTAGHWIGITDKYLAIRIKLAGLWHYGWIRLDVPADAGNYTVKDYAYNNNPGQAILAGDKGTNIISRDIYKTNFHVMVDQRDKLIKIDFAGNNVTDGNVCIYNVEGIKVLNKKCHPDTQVEISTTGWEAGLYFVDFHYSNQHITRIVIIL